MGQLCNTRHDIPVTLHTPGAYGQCSVFDHSGKKHSAVLGTRYGTLYKMCNQRLSCNNGYLNNVILKMYHKNKKKCT